MKNLFHSLIFGGLSLGLSQQSEAQCDWDCPTLEHAHALRLLCEGDSGKFFNALNVCRVPYGSMWYWGEDNYGRHLFVTIKHVAEKDRLTTDVQSLYLAEVDANCDYESDPVGPITEFTGWEILPEYSLSPRVIGVPGTTSLDSIQVITPLDTNWEPNSALMPGLKLDFRSYPISQATVVYGIGATGLNCEKGLRISTLNQTGFGPAHLTSRERNFWRVADYPVWYGMSGGPMISLANDSVIGVHRSMLAENTCSGVKAQSARSALFYWQEGHNSFSLPVPASMIAGPVFEMGNSEAHPVEFDHYGVGASPWSTGQEYYDMRSGSIDRFTNNSSIAPGVGGDVHFKSQYSVGSTVEIETDFDAHCQIKFSASGPSACPPIADVVLYQGPLSSVGTVSPVYQISYTLPVPATCNGAIRQGDLWITIDEGPQSSGGHFVVRIH